MHFRNSLISLSLAAVLLSCNKTVPDEHKKFDSTYANYVHSLSENEFQDRYKALLERFEQRRRAYKRQIMAVRPEQAESIRSTSQRDLFITIRDSIIPYWYGTSWDYNGTTTTPGQGAIACGYFITTIAEHAGIKLDRVRLAQQASIHIIHSLCKKETLKGIGHQNFDYLCSYMQLQPEGLYIIGLDNHVAFLSREDGDTFVIHANGIRGSYKVEKEPLTECVAVKNSVNYFVASFIPSSRLLSNWISGTHHPTITQ